MCGINSETSVTDLLATTGASKFTFSDVLNKLFKDAQLPPSVAKQDFAGGFLCADCKDPVGDLDKMQHQVIAAKKSIINLFKKSKQPEKKKEEAFESVLCETKTDNKKESTLKENNQQKEKDKARKKKVQKEPEDDVYIIESLKEKKGNNFLVKWENYSDEENTWEPRASIPGFVLKVGI